MIAATEPLSSRIERRLAYTHARQNLQRDSSVMASKLARTEGLEGGPIGLRRSAVDPAPRDRAAPGPRAA
jgi:hypothetical protein